MASAHINALPAVKLMPVGFQPGNTGWKYPLSFPARCPGKGLPLSWVMQFLYQQNEA